MIVYFKFTEPKCEFQEMLDRGQLTNKKVSIGNLLTNHSKPRDEGGIYVEEGKWVKYYITSTL